MAEDGDVAKVVLVGAANVGKTSIITRAFKNYFSEDVKPTIGSGFAKGTFKGSTRSVALEVWDTAGQELYARLASLRGALAREQNVPAYIVFSNATLVDMCAKRPRTREEFLGVSGVGAKKAELYADAFLAEIAR